MNDFFEIKTSKELLDKQYNRTGLFVLYPFLIFVCFLLIFLIFGSKEIVVKGSGLIASDFLGTELTSPASSKITEVHVQNNQSVKKGELLVSFDSTNIEFQINLVKDSLVLIEEKERYLKLLEESVKSLTNLLPDSAYGYSSQYENYVIAIKKIKTSIKENNSNNKADMNSLEKNYDRVMSKVRETESILKDYDIFKTYIKMNVLNDVKSSLVASEVSIYESSLANIVNESSDEESKNAIENLKITTINSIEQTIESRKQELSNLNESLITIENSLAENKTNFEVEQLEMDLEAKKMEFLSTIEGKFEELKSSQKELANQLVSYEEELLKYALYATAEGRVELSTVLSKGSVISEGTSIGKIVTDNNNNNFIELYISDSDIMGIKINDAIKFSVNDNTTNKNIVVQGTIEFIQTEPIQTENGSYFTVRCRIEENTNIPYGTSGTVTVITGKTNYLYYFYKKFFK